MPFPIATGPFSDALVILGAAGVVIPIFARFRITPVIGFILVGMAVGPNALGSLAGQFPWLSYVTISNPEAIAPFAEFGIILLLFAIGLELSFKRLWGMRRLVFGVGAAELLGAALIIGLSLYGFGTPWSGALALGLGLALSSTALVLPLVGTSSAVGRAALAMLLFEDLALVPIIFALGALAPYAGDEGIGSLARILVFGFATVAGMMVLGRLFLPRLFAQAARTKSPELFLAASLLVVIVASLATTAVGLSPIVGALIAGVLIAETDYHDAVEGITAPFRGLALGIFLITVGMSVDFRLIAANWQMLVVAVIGVLLVKATVTALLLRLAGTSRAVAAEAGVLMSSPSETTLIVLGAAGAAQLITRDAAAFWQIVTAIGLTFTPLLAKLGRVAARRIGQPERIEMEMPQSQHPATIIGFGRVGRLVSEMLDVHGKPYIAIDSDVDAVAAANRNGHCVMFGDASRPSLIERLDLANASALILTMDDPALLVRLTRRVRKMHPDLIIVARARDTVHAAELYRAGATNAVPETLESSLQLSEAVLVDLGVAMGPVIASIHDKRAEMRKRIMEMGELENPPALWGRRLRDEMEAIEQ
jgi:CPA2 family monovalent cation:H+ antiporter-2